MSLSAARHSFALAAFCFKLQNVCPNKTRAVKLPMMLAKRQC